MEKYNTYKLLQTNLNQKFSYPTFFSTYILNVFYDTIGVTYILNHSVYYDCKNKTTLKENHRSLIVCEKKNIKDNRNRTNV